MTKIKIYNGITFDLKTSKVISTGSVSYVDKDEVIQAKGKGGGKWRKSTNSPQNKALMTSTAVANNGSEEADADIHRSTSAQEREEQYNAFRGSHIKLIMALNATRKDAGLYTGNWRKEGLINAELYDEIKRSTYDAEETISALSAHTNWVSGDPLYTDVDNEIHGEMGEMMIELAQYVSTTTSQNKRAAIGTGGILLLQGVLLMGLSLALAALPVIGPILGGATFTAGTGYMVFKPKETHKIGKRYEELVKKVNSTLSEITELNENLSIQKIEALTKEVENEVELLTLKTDQGEEYKPHSLSAEMDNKANISNGVLDKSAVRASHAVAKPQNNI